MNGLGLGLSLALGNVRASVKQISGLGLLYDASGAAAGTLSTIADLSGNGHTGTAQGTTKPAYVANVQNGHSVLRGAGNSGERVELTGPTFGASVSIIWVGTSSAATSSYFFANSSNLLAMISRFVSTKLEWFGDATERPTINAAPGTAWHIWQIDHTDAGSYFVFEDNVQVATGSSHVTMSGSSFSRLFSAGNNLANYQGDLGEWAVWPNKVLSTAERNAAYQILKPKWNTP
jgi:hypothetical protein